MFNFNWKKAHLCILISAIIVSLPDFISADNKTTEYIINSLLYFFGAIIGLIGALEFKKNPHSA